MSWLKTNYFWNSKKNVNHFAQKPADPRVKKRLEQLLDQRESESEMLALDLGCGGGRHAQLLVDLGFKTSVLDLHWQMLQATAERVGESNLFSLECGTITELPYEHDAFDVVVATGVLHQAKNLNEYQRAISELSRILKPGGVACVNIFTSLMLDDSYKKLSDAFVYQTKEGLAMTLLSKKTFYELMAWGGLALEEELSEDVVNEHTGKRSVLRCNFIKTK